MIFKSNELAEAMNVKIGDIIVVEGVQYQIGKDYICENLEDHIRLALSEFVDCHYEIITPIKKKVGNLKVCEYTYDIERKYKLTILTTIIEHSYLDYKPADDETLYNVANNLKEKRLIDYEIYQIIKKRLDKEID